MKNAVFWDVTSCGSLRTYASEERNASIFRMKRISVLATKLAISKLNHTRRTALADFSIPGTEDVPSPVPVGFPSFIGLLYQLWIIDDDDDDDDDDVGDDFEQLVN
jgi:hypothetical protein